MKYSLPVGVPVPHGICITVFAAVMSQKAFISMHNVAVTEVFIVLKNMNH